MTVVIRHVAAEPKGDAKPWREYQLTRGAIQAGAVLGLSPDALLSAARSAAAYTADPRGTHRHKDLLFSIRDNTVWGVWGLVEGRFVEVQPVAKKPFNQGARAQKRDFFEHNLLTNMVRATCPTCDGDGCVGCSHTGVVNLNIDEYQQRKFEASVT